MIYWSDETGICNQDQIGKGYAPKGQTPILTQTGQKFSTDMIAAVSNRGLMRFQFYKGALNVAIFIEFHERLHPKREAKGLFADFNADFRVHHAKAVSGFGWCATRSKSRSFYLPAYAPEHNPDEYLNNDLKQTIKKKPRAAGDGVRHRYLVDPQMRSRETPGDRGQVILSPAKHVRYAA